MADITLHRTHTLGLPAARHIAHTWAAQAEGEFGMACTYEEGPSADLLSFKRAGVAGTLRITETEFKLNATLGFLMSAFKEKIEQVIAKNFDALLAVRSLGSLGSLRSLGSLGSVPQAATTATAP